MTALPAWIEERIERDTTAALTQRHVVEAMLTADRPVLSVRELQSRLEPIGREEAIRRRLEELRANGVVGVASYPPSTALYYVDWPVERRPWPPAETAGQSANPLDRLSARAFLTLRDPAGIRTLVLAGYQLSLLLFALGVVLGVAGIGPPASSDHELWSAAANLLVVCLAVQLAERLARRLRSER